jgi:trans-L-3-hydroxyproline dehydratase
MLSTLAEKWDVPGRWLRIIALEVHTEGEPLRVVTGGAPPLRGDSIMAQYRYATEHLDYLRTALVSEPRGHTNMAGCILTPPLNAAADLGAIFMHNGGFSAKGGDGIIGLATVAVETGMVERIEPETVVHIDTPAGLVSASARVARGRVWSAYLHNEPSFVLALEERIDVPGVGSMRYDLAFGGAFFAYVRSEEAGVSCTPGDYRMLVEKGMAISQAIATSHPIVHPFKTGVGRLSGTIFTARPQVHGADTRHVCVFSRGHINRSPTGTGVSGRMAILLARGEIGLHQPVIVESIIGTRFIGRIVERSTMGAYTLVMTEVEGSAHITGRHEFLIDPDDPLKRGFLLDAPARIAEELLDHPGERMTRRQ